MDNQAVMPPSTAAATPVPSTLAKKKEHLLVELVGGFTLASTIVSGMAMWYLMVAYVFPLS